MPKKRSVVFPSAAAQYFVKRMAEIADDIISDDDSLADHLSEAEGALADEIVKKFRIPLPIVLAFTQNQDGWSIVPAKIRTEGGRVLVSLEDIAQARQDLGE